MLGFGEAPIETYKSYKAKKFKKYEDRIVQLLKGISSLSLNKEDKARLLNKLKQVSTDFQL